LDLTLQSLRAFLPQRNTVPRHERMRSVAGALVGLLLTAGLSMQLLGMATLPLALVAPMGASAVLLFCLPASPLAQPWAVIGGNTISALVGIACAKAIGNPLLAAPLAGSLAILVMFLLRCLHPPSGAVALTAVLGGPAVHAAGLGFALVPVCLNSALIVLVALVFNNLTGRRYPHTQQSMLQNLHATRDPVPTARIGFTKEDLDAALARYGQVLDISRDDLESLIRQTEMESWHRRLGTVRCADIMSRDPVVAEFGMPLQEAWTLMHERRIKALPVTDRTRRVVGIVTQADFFRQIDLEHHEGIGGRLRHFIRATRSVVSNKPEVVGQIMTRQVRVASEDRPLAELVPLFSEGGHHHIPIIDAERRLTGMVTQSDFVRALYRAVGPEN
jgi:CBS domain-containing membrane protein